jgi:hypothetical protein
MKKFVRETAFLVGLALVLAVPQAYAGMIATDAERDRVKSMLERPEVAAEMQKMGIPAGEAKARVDAMTPAELAQVAGRLDSLPAGGAMTNQELLLVILLIVLVAILI